MPTGWEARSTDLTAEFKHLCTSYTNTMRRLRGEVSRNPRKNCLLTLSRYFDFTDFVLPSFWRRCIRGPYRGVGIGQESCCLFAATFTRHFFGRIRSPHCKCTPFFYVHQNYIVTDRVQPHVFLTFESGTVP